MSRRAGFEIADQLIAPGQRARIDLPIAGQYTTTPVLLPIQVLHGRRDGPVVWVSAAVHGDEITAWKLSAGCWGCRYSNVCAAP